MSSSHQDQLLHYRQVQNKMPTFLQPYCDERLDFVLAENVPPSDCSVDQKLDDVARLSQACEDLDSRGKDFVEVGFRRAALHHFMHGCNVSEEAGLKSFHSTKRCELDD